MPRKEGVMVLELAGDKKKFRQGVKYLKSEGIQVDYASQEIMRDKKNAPIAALAPPYAPPVR